MSVRGQNNTSMNPHVCLNTVLLLGVLVAGLTGALQ